MRKKKSIFLILFFTALIILPSFMHPLLRSETNAVTPGAGDNSANIIEELKLFSKAMSVIDEAYPENLDLRDLLYAAVRGMMASLDRFSEFIEPERYELLKIHMKGEYAGIGAVLQMLDGIPAIRMLKPDSAAQKAGLEVMDKILKINGESTGGLMIPDVAKRLRGEENTTLTLTIQRDRIKKTFDVKIVREKVVVQSTKDEKKIGKALGYLRIEGWQDNTAEQFDSSLKKLKKQKIKALIIDLRNNDGGLLSEAVALAERFLPGGTKIVSVDSKIPEQKKEYIASGNGYLKENYPLIILVNEKSASASEVFSGAMQDNKRATILGIKTYGKGSVQSVIPLDDQSALKLTTARYLTPAGHNLNHVGITPDEIIENQEGVPTDFQLLKAIEKFKEYM